MMNLKILMLNRDKGFIDKNILNRSNMWITISNNEVLPKEKYMFLIGMIKNIDIVVIDLELKYLSTDDVFISALAYSINTPIYGVGAYEEHDLLNLSMLRIFPDYLSLEDHINNLIIA